LGDSTATDIAFAWLVARSSWNNHPVIAFLLLLAIADDAIGLAIIAIFYPNPAFPVEPAWLLLTVAAMVAAYLLRRYDCRNYWAYILLGGVPSWMGLHSAHLHPALALVFIVPFLPHPRKETKHLFEEDPTDFSTLAHFEYEWKIIVDFGLSCSVWLMGGNHRDRHSNLAGLVSLFGKVRYIRHGYLGVNLLCTC
jgi:NhaA family Na+:H+ antiporter